MKAHYIFFAIIALAISACARNTEPSEPEGMQMTFTAYQEGSEMTRTTVQEGGTQVFWEPADEIKVFFNGSSGRFVSQNTENATVATFTGTLNVIVGATEGAGYSTQTWGLYPYRADAVLDGNAMVTTLPASQTGRAGSFAKNTNITVAQSNGYGLAFYNVCGGLRFSLTQEGIKRVTFQGNNGEAIAGKIKVAFADGIPAVQEVSESETVITLTAPGGGTFQTGQWYYISAIPGSLSNGYKMTFYKETESAKLTSSSSVTFKRGIFGSLADVDKDLMFKPSGGGDEPNPDDVIQFADPIAKYACVEKFDTNGDGEVSYAEAAAATSLEGLFTNWNTVTSFDEIKYFTGITSIDGVFSGLTQLKHITVPDWITTLGSNAFQNCFALNTVVLPASLSSIPTYCFDCCSALKDVTLPSGITSIPNYCFRSCTALTSIALPSSVTSLGQYAFSGCSLLSSLDLPSGFKTIGNYAFQNCRAITAMDFPTSLSSIGQCAFIDCTALSSISIGSGVFVGASAFKNCTSLALANLGDHVSLGNAAFFDCSSLTTLVLPSDLLSIPQCCFQGCTALKTITWPQELTTIDNYAFAGCGFDNCGYAIELPATITSIGTGAFSDLHHIILPSLSPISISYEAFSIPIFLYVPKQMVEMYRSRSIWNSYCRWIHPIEEYPVDLSIGGSVGEAIDLGLSVKWANWNVGASAPEDYGAFLAWGEIDVKWESEYKWGGELGISGYQWTKYGNGDGRDTLEPEDDAAHVHWGGAWRMPTRAEINELINNSTTEWTAVNGVYGCLFTSKKEGYTDKSIFLPAYGYWSSSLAFINNRPDHAYGMYFNSSDVSIDQYSFRTVGESIRPVCEK